MTLADRTRGAAEIASFERYAIYFAPASESLLGKLARTWLGHDAESGKTGALAVDAADQWVAQPRRYGFHATLKAPMRLAPGENFRGLEAAVERLASTHTTVPLGLLNIAELGNFLALVPADPDPALQQLAFDCVRALDRFRAALTPDEIARRGALSGEHKSLLEQWGYPYVGTAFRFHMTLTSALDEEPRTLARHAAEEHFEPALSKPQRLDSVSIFGDPGEGRPFRLLRRFPLRGS